MLEWVLRYIRLGWPVIPLRGKLPLTEHGSKDATLNESVAREWWAKWPNANIGVATGHRFFVIDVDVRKGGEETWDMLRSQYVALPETIEQLTGTGGKHILYALPDFPVKNSSDKIGPGVDVRGVGGYIVACPSIHPETGRAYVWDGIEEIENQTIAKAPVWVLRAIQESDRRASVQGKEAGLPNKILEGSRNERLFKIGARLRRTGFSAEEIFATLKATNRERCEPQLSEDEVRTIANSAARYTPEAKADLFRSSSAKMAGSADATEELPLSQADVEAAVDDCIARNDLRAAIALAPEVAKLRPHAQAVIKIKLRLHFKRDWPTREFEALLRPEGNVIQMPPPGSGEAAGNTLGPNLLFYPYTDSGNGERIVAMFGDDMRYCVEMQKWLVWDGKRWAADEKQEATQRAKRMARRLHEQALEAAAGENYMRLMALMPANAGDPRRFVERFARASESHAGITAALKRAATEPAMPVHAAELDQHPLLLNCLNGVVDLRTGKLLPHDRGYLITKMCHVTYRPDAGCPRFLKFLHWAMGDNPEADLTQRTVRLISFLQRAFGYSISADVSEKCVFVFWGHKGNNGKTTLLTVFRELLSEYSAQISIDTLMTQKVGDAALRADMADLRGARFVITSEVEKEHRLSEGKLKYLTAGMGAVKSCRKYENPIEFEATHKLFMDCNHRPAVRGTDDAIWSRLKPVPFEVRIEKTDPEYDTKLKDKLMAEGEGILAWAVRGCRAWLKDGLGDPPEVTQANIAWREHDDPLKEFIEDCCEVGDDFWVRSSELSNAYAWWCKQNRERFPLGREAFGERIASKGFRHSRSRRSSEGKQMRTVEGLAVKGDVAKAVVGSGDLRGALDSGW